MMAHVLMQVAHRPCDLRVRYPGSPQCRKDGCTTLTLDGLAKMHPRVTLCVCAPTSLSFGRLPTCEAATEPSGGWQAP